MGRFSRKIIAFQREIADFDLSRTGRFCDLRDLCHADITAGEARLMSAVNSLYHDPSPDRYVPFRAVSVTTSAGMAKNRKADFVRLAFWRDLAESVRIITPNKGRTSCLRHPISSQQPHSLASRLVLPMTASARLLVLALVVLLATQLATITAFKAHLLAALSAHLPTTCKVTRQKISTKITEIAAAGHTCARRFCI